MAEASPKKKWTVMVYLAGDNNLDGPGVVDLQEMKRVGSTPDINLLAQFDRQGMTLSTKRYFLKKDTPLEQDVVADLGETNTGEPQVLEDFIHWGAVNHPAEHYLIVLWNHGMGWDDTNVYRAANRILKLDVVRKGEVAAHSAGEAMGVVSSSRIRTISDRRFRRALFSTTIARAVNARGIAYDDNAKDFLDNIEIKRLLTSAKKTLKQNIDILGMDACLMSMVEVGYQVRNSVKYTVGSEQIEPGDGWPYDTILAELAKKPTMTPAALSKIIVKKYLAAYSTAEPVTQSAFDLTQSNAIATAIDQLAKLLTSKLSNAKVRAAITHARNRVQAYQMPEYIDLIDFVTLLKSQVTLSKIKSACQNVIDAAKVGQFVVASGYKGQPVAKSHGVSIYFPTARISPLYAKLDFVQNTAWDEFLHAYITAMAR